MVTQLARTWGERLLRPLAGLLWRLGLTPNSVTVLGFGLTCVVAAILATGEGRVWPAPS